MTELQYKVKALEERVVYLKNQCDKLEEEARKKIREDDKEEQKSMIRIGGYGGIEIPIDKKIKDAISNFVYGHVRQMIKEDKELQKNFFLACLRYKEYFKEIFSPLIKETVEEMDFTVKFDSD